MIIKLKLVQFRIKFSTLNLYSTNWLLLKWAWKNWVVFYFSLHVSLLFFSVGLIDEQVFNLCNSEWNSALFFFKCQDLCENILRMFNLLSALVLVFKKWVFKHKDSSNMMPRNMDWDYKESVPHFELEIEKNVKQHFKAFILSHHLYSQLTKLSR